MKFFTALCALVPLVAGRGQPESVLSGRPDQAGPPDHAGPPEHVLEMFREKFGVKPGANLRM